MADLPNLKGKSPIRLALNAIDLGIIGDALLGRIGELKKGFVFEMIDIRNPKDSEFQSLVINPQRYTITEPFSVNLTPTEDDNVVAEENGQIIREITIEGTTGLRDRKEDAFVVAQGDFMSGPDHFFKLRKFFRRYGNRKKDPAESPFWSMIFHNVKEDDHWVVVPRSFETPRDAKSNRFHYNYRITLAAIQPSPPEPKVVDGFLADLKQIVEFVHDARSFFVQGLNEIDTIRERVNNIDAMFDSVGGVLNDAFDFVTDITDLIEVSKEFFEETKLLIEDARELLGNNLESTFTDDQMRAERNLRDMEDALDKIGEDASNFGGTDPTSSDPLSPLGQFAGPKLVTNQDLRDQTGGATLGTRLRLTLGSHKNKGVPLPPFSGTRRITLANTDTIDSVSGDHDVPKAVIIAVNDLRFPYIARDAGPGTRGPGDSLLVPIAATGPLQGRAPSDPYLTPEDILYGVDLALDPKVLAEEGRFEIMVDEVHGALDADLVRGVDNAVQGLQIIIGTEQGTTAIIRDIGIRRAVGMRGTLDRMLSSSLNMREAILADPRVTGIQSTRIVLEGDKIEQELTVNLTSLRDGVNLTVPFGSVQGES